METKTITGLIAEFFKFNEQNTDWRTEITGGITTFVTHGLYHSREPGHVIRRIG